MTRRSRGQSAVLGLVVLIGVVALASIGILLVASESADEMEQQAEKERVESAFVELGTELETATSSGDVDRAIELAFDDEEGTLERKSTGNVSVTVNGTEIVNATLGTIEYTTSDGTTIAYQGGGVWRATGNESVVISEPDVHVRDQTLNLPVYALADDGRLSNGPLQFSKVNSTAAYSGLLAPDENLTISVTTEYARGWERYFESFENASVTRHSGAGDLERVEVTFATSELVDVSPASAAGTVTETPAGTIASDSARDRTSFEIPVRADFTEAVNVGESIDIKGNTLYGNVSAGDDVEINSGDSVGDIEAKGSVDLERDHEGDIVAKDDVHLEGGVTVDGTIVASGAVTAGSGVRVTGDVVSYDEIDFGGGSSVDGECVATGSIAASCGTSSSNADQATIDRHPDQYVEDTDLPAFDDEIAEMIEHGEDEGATFRTVTGGETFDDPGRHYVETIDLTNGGQDPVVLDVAKGDVELVVRGDMDFKQNAKLRVVNADSGNVARIFTAGDIRTASGGKTLMCVAAGNPASSHCPGETSGDVQAASNANALQVYGTNGSTFEFGQNSQFHGVLYAPGTELAANNKGDFFGTIVVDTFAGGTNNINFRYDEDLEDLFVNPKTDEGRRYPPGMGELRGWVTGRATGDPIPNATVDVAGWSNSTETDDDGSYSFDEVPAGEYDVTVGSGGYQNHTVADVPVDASGRTTQNVSLAGTDGTIVGTVTDSNTSAPIRNGPVTLTDDGGTPIATETTASDGSYSFDVGPGTYTIVADGDDYVRENHTLEVDAGETFRVDFELERRVDPEWVYAADGLMYLHVTAHEVTLED